MLDDPETLLFVRFRDRADVDALGRLYDATAAELLRVAMHLVRDPGRAEDLALDEPPNGFPSDKQFAVSSFSLGYIQELGRMFGATIGLGAMGPMNWVPADIESAYGSRTPVAGVLFLRVRPFHKPSGMGGMHDMHRP